MFYLLAAGTSGYAVRACPRRAPLVRMEADAPPHRAGFVSILGVPNVGKSTLMNALVGERRPLPGEESAEGTRLVSLGDGRLTVKEDVGVHTIFQARGILAEFKLVGRFDAGPRAVAAG